MAGKVEMEMSNKNDRTERPINFNKYLILCAIRSPDGFDCMIA